MDIPSINNSDIAAFISNNQQNQATIESFNNVFSKALEDHTAMEEKELRNACEMFESYFLQMMFREMRKTSFDENGYIPKSFAEKTFIDMLDEEVSKSLAKSGGVGLAEQLYRQMTMYGAGIANMYRSEDDI